MAGGTSLDDVAALIGWAALDHLLSAIAASAKGEAGWLPPAPFKAMLIAVWHDLSDVRLAEVLAFPVPPRAQWRRRHR